MSNSILVNLLVWYLVFLFSTSLHEAAHAWAAARGGDFTAYAAGQVTLNPVPHIRREKFGMIVMPFLSFFLNGGAWMWGWASAPFNPAWAARYPGRSLIMALAGPLSHLAPILAAWTVMLIGLATGFFGFPTHRGMFPVDMGNGGSFSWGLASLCNIVYLLNSVLLVFNLMPLPPMDGSEIWIAFAAREEDRLRRRSLLASYSFVGMVLAWYLFPRVYTPMISLSTGILYRLSGMIAALS
ncbi:MAG: site-2 protease family protein [Planctomycetota bacterium]|jgi:Zn-dependent protease|nr:site-2 protease family protein [Planctomycetota bacterium]